MTIDEAIEELKSENGYYANNGMTDVAEFNTKIIYLLEELKGLRTNIKFNKNLAYNMAIDDYEVNLKEAIGYIAFNPTDEELFIDIIEYTAEFLRRNKNVGNNTR